MFRRMKLIYGLGGYRALFSILFVLFGCIWMPIAEWIYYGTCYGGVAAAVLIVLGWMLRKPILEFVADYGDISKKLLFVYVCLFLVLEYVGNQQYWQVLSGTVLLTVVFNLRFWSITEAALHPEEFELGRGKQNR